MAATITVDSTADDNDGVWGNGHDTLREAVAYAAAGDTINFSLTYPATITLSSTLTIDKNLAIYGPGASNLTVSGNNSVGVFQVNAWVTFTLDSLTVAGGSSSDGGGICNRGTVNVNNITFSGNSATLNGGGINNLAGTVTVSNSTFSGNSAGERGGGIYTNSGTVNVNNSTISGNSAAVDGGGIYNYFGTFTVSNSTISGNSAAYYCGGIENLAGTLTVSNSTISGNSATFYGGGIYNNVGTVTVSNSTISGNWADYDGGGIYNLTGTVTVSNSTISGNSATAGGGIYNEDTLYLYNTIIANSPAGGDCAGYVSSGSNNLIFDSGNACYLTDGTNGNIIGSDPKLGPLAGNGGPTFTHALLIGSPAIDAGDDTTCAASPVSGLDQRGTSRPHDLHCDIGAYEYVSSVTTTALSSSPNPSVYGSSVTFTATVSDSEPAYTPTGAVTFKDGGTDIPGCTGVALSGVTAECMLSTLSLGSHSITAEYSGDSIFSGSTSTGLMQDVCLNSVTVISIGNSGPGTLRQAIADICPDGTIDFSIDGELPLASTLTITKNMTIDGAGHSVTVSGNISVGVFQVNTGVTFTLYSLTVAYGASADGGGINNAGTVTVNNSTFSDNLATAGGGGIYNAGTLTVNNSTFYNNGAGLGGGGINNVGTVTVNNSTFSGNWSTAGGGIYNTGTFNMYNTMIANSSGGDCVGGVSGSNNLIQDGSCNPALSGDPMLGLLQDNGGPTQTIALLAGSPAINAGAGCPATDQRGIARPQGTSCDIGAYEFVTTTTTALSSSLNPSNFGDSVTFTATVSDSETASTPTGTVTFRDGGMDIAGCVSVALTGVSADCTLSTLAGGTHSITAVYSGDSNFTASTALILTQTVNPANQVALTLNAGTPLTYNVTETLSTTGGSGTGTVSYQVTAGSCTVTGDQLTANSGTGTCSVTATKAADANYNSATATATVTLQKAISMTTISSDTPDPSIPGQAVTVSFAVLGSGIPTGNVTVTDGVDSCTGTVASGSCSLVLTVPGARTLIATYSGDANFSGSISAGVSHTVTEAEPTTATLTISKTGKGKGTVTSSPSGISCGWDCEQSYESGTHVDLSAVPSEWSEFAGWSGACTGTGTCRVAMNSDRGVTASFILKKPSAFSYLPIASPLLGSNRQEARPIGVGDMTEGGPNLSIRIGLSAYAEPVDLYVVIYSPDIDPGHYYLLMPDNTLRLLSEGVVPWRSGAEGDINQGIFGDIPVSSIHPARYDIYLMAAPAGTTETYHLWLTSFEVPAPDMVMPLPTGTEMFGYEAGAFPYRSIVPAFARPLGIGSFSVNGEDIGLSPINSSGVTIEIQAGLPAFESPVDLYLGIHAPSIDPDHLYLLGADGGLYPLTGSLTVWKKGHVEAFAEQPFGSIPVSSLPEGSYLLYLLATPEGSLEHYYLWSTDFSISR